MTSEVELPGDSNRPNRKFRLGLALSGGGFRAAIFHLGVIRRLEELGIMKDVDAISAVSGGSIIAAYYACEMEKRLRQVEPRLWQDTKTRIEIYEGIARDFLKATDHNLRTRALVFTPFFHPFLFIKTLVLKAFRAGARSELIQREYDHWFYHEDTIDQLPSVTPERSKSSDPVLLGPQILLNSTSLLTGERVSFSRVPNSGMTEMKRSNKNSLPLSRVVGASSGVPVLFPPTPIYGDLLVDGGVADNQGIEALLPAETPPSEGIQVLLVSDASGQLEAIHTISGGGTEVFLRVNEVLQSQVRSKLIDRLVQWKEDLPDKRYFAFTHLFLNLKDRGVSERLPAEMIPGVARIRTDLDQFSFIERDSLMYHGYTLIDAQIRKYCRLLVPAVLPPLTAPPLYSSQALNTRKKRDDIRRELEAGAQKVFLWRSFKKYSGPVGTVLTGWAVAWLVALYFLFARYTRPLRLVREWMRSLLNGVTSGWIGGAINWLLQHAKTPGLTALIDSIAGILSAALLAAIAGYVLAFPTYELVRRLAMRADLQVYRDLTGSVPTTRWQTEPPAEQAQRAVAG